MSKEEWVEIKDHLKYLINNYGEVFSIKTRYSWIPIEARRVSGNVGL